MRGAGHVGFDARDSRVETNVIRTDQHGSMHTAALHSPDIRQLSLYMYILKHVLACPREREGEMNVRSCPVVGNVAATRGREVYHLRCREA